MAAGNRHEDRIAKRSLNLDLELFSTPNLEAKKIERVVVRGTNWVGDAVMTIPALRELRRVLPKAHITLATRSSTKAIFDEADFLDDVLVYDRGPSGLGAVMHQIKEWRARRFDLAVLLQNAFEAALIGFCARVPARLGYSTDGRKLLLTHPITIPSWRSERHEVFYYLNIVAELEKCLGSESDIMSHVPDIGLTVSNERQKAARELLIANGAHLDRHLVALCPGSTNSRAKRWPAERFAALADKIVDDMKVDVVLVGSADELEVSRKVTELMRSTPVMLTGHTDLAQAIAVLSLADVLVTNDTGPSHISAALDRPTLVIFGPTEPATTRPYSNSAEVIRQPPDCAPCMLRDCPIDHRCMTAISPDDVFARVSALLSTQRVEVRA